MTNLIPTYILQLSRAWEMIIVGKGVGNLENIWKLGVIKIKKVNLLIE